MGDDRLRELERAAAGGDEEARMAFARELARSRDPRVLEIEAHEERLRAWLEGIRDDVPGCPELRLDTLQACVQMALIEGRGFDSTLGFGFKTLTKIWAAGSRPGTNRGFDWDERTDPVTVMAFAVRQGDSIRVRVGETDSAKPTPGTVWKPLAPWRTSSRAETLERKCRAWWEHGGPAQEFSVETARLWIDLGALEAKSKDPSPVVNLDRASEKQVKFIESLRDQKGVDDERFAKLLWEHGSVKRLDFLERQGASGLIEAMLKLPNVPAKGKAPRRADTSKAGASSPAKGKVTWSGVVESVQPRIRLMRVGGEEQHGYQGYVLRLRGAVGDDQRPFTVAIGKAAEAKHAFQAGDRVSGAAVAVPDPQREPADFYKASKLALEAREPSPAGAPPPHLGAPPPLTDYRAQGHRRLSERAYSAECAPCIWACRMPVEEGASRATMVACGVEAMCYGPRDCFFFEAPS